MGRVDHHPGEPGDVKQPLLLVEIPGAALLRHQPPLQPVGELGDRALQMDELLVQIGAQPAELLLVAQRRSGDLLVELAGEDPVVEARRQVGERPVRADREHALLAVLAHRVAALARLLLGPVALALLLAGFLLLAANLRFAAAGIRFLVLVVVLAALGLVAALAFLALVGIIIALGLALDQFEIAEQLAGEVREEFAMIREIVVLLFRGVRRAPAR